jgi:hypothetical protein
MQLPRRIYFFLSAMNTFLSVSSYVNGLGQDLNKLDKELFLNIKYVNS